MTRTQSSAATSAVKASRSWMPNQHPNWRQRGGAVHLERLVLLAEGLVQLGVPTAFDDAPRVCQDLRDLRLAALLRPTGPVGPSVVVIAKCPLDVLHGVAADHRSWQQGCKV